MRTAALIDQVRERANIPSDYRLAKILGVGTQTVSQWRGGDTYPSTMHMFRLAELAGRAPADVIAELEVERAEKAGRVDQVEGWRGMLARLGGVAASAIVGAVLSCPAPAQASASAPAAHPDSLYIM